MMEGTNGLPSSKSTTWSFQNLIELHCNQRGSKCIIPSNELLQLQMLERIQVEGCFHVEEVFEGTNSVVEIPNLRQLELKSVYFLKYIWKHDHYQRTVLMFPNLTALSIDKCDKLKHVFTSSMVGSLLRLQQVHISDCEYLKVIVKEEELEVAPDAKVKEIMELPCLTSLKLENLKSLKGFYLGEADFSWPSLHTLEIKECPEIRVFTNGHLVTPALKVIDTSFGRCYETEDINSFIKTKQDEVTRCLFVL
ncbi:putative leucine-rich repeat domain superfamily [Helianthus anomalus]